MHDALKRRMIRYWQSFSYVGLIFATLFFAASVTPSLLPRHYVTQGVLSGFALAIGYGLGVLLLHLWDFLELRKPTRHHARMLKRATTISVAMVLIIVLWKATAWQNSIRELMEMEPLRSAYPTRFFAIAAVLAAIVITGVRLFVHSCIVLAQPMKRVLPRRVSYALSTIVVASVVMFVFNDVVARSLLRAADRVFLRMDGLIDEGIEQPTDPLVCGSPDSCIPWAAIGRQGKNFIIGGPSQQAISEFWSQPALRPIRVYAGMETDLESRQNADIALAELKRTGGFDRSVLIIATPTGTGWLDPGGVDTIEYLHRGDTAIVATQYSYLPSWLTILVDPDRSKRSARVLFEEVYEYWKTLAHDQRPKLYLHGLSLGSLGSESSADMFTIFEDPIQGALWSGPPFPSNQWAAATAARNPDSPAWLPEFRDGALLRFTSQTNTLRNHRPWGGMRYVYVQYASDPMIFFSPSLLYRKPAWLNEPRGPDVSPKLRWLPIITFLQIAADLPLATSVPIGYGHNYAPEHYLDAWVAVTDPEDVSDSDIQRLKETLSVR